MPTKDRSRVATFYTEVFGWKMDQLGPEMGKYVSFIDSEGNVVGMLQPSQDM